MPAIGRQGASVPEGFSNLMEESAFSAREVEVFQGGLTATVAGQSRALASVFSGFDANEIDPAFRDDEVVGI